MSSAITERIADICDLARLNTELVVMARRRGRQETEQINEYLRSLEFRQRAEVLEPRVRAELAQVGLYCCRRSQMRLGFLLTSPLRAGFHNLARPSVMS